MASWPFWVRGRLTIKSMDILSHLFLGMSKGCKKACSFKSLGFVNLTLVTFSHIAMYVKTHLRPIELSGDENECILRRDDQMRVARPLIYSDTQGP